uniref:Uncharacterized protein LOC100178133 n=1 Tax=Phallusia mammillata TaxID=59560 RepID=A0A6F9DGU0_9ASCI|nr:uncharacterized protein LOC100178133 [Phallusia mammillata]
MAPYEQNEDGLKIKFRINLPPVLQTTPNHIFHNQPVSRYVQEHYSNEPLELKPVPSSYYITLPQKGRSECTLSVTEPVLKSHQGKLYVNPPFSKSNPKHIELYLDNPVILSNPKHIALYQTVPKLQSDPSRTKIYNEKQPVFVSQTPKITLDQSRPEIANKTGSYLKQNIPRMANKTLSTLQKNLPVISQKIAMVLEKSQPEI